MQGRGTVCTESQMWHVRSYYLDIIASDELDIRTITSGLWQGTTHIMTLS